MKIYLDNCALQRPLDDTSKMRIRLESEAVIEIIEVIESHTIELLTSTVLEYEIHKWGDPFRVEFTLRILSLASKNITLQNHIIERAVEFESYGVDGIDALHLAAAEDGGADYLCTCDVKFLKRSKEIRGGVTTKVISPVSFVEVHDENPDLLESHPRRPTIYPDLNHTIPGYILLSNGFKCKIWSSERNLRCKIFCVSAIREFP